MVDAQMGRVDAVSYSDTRRIASGVEANFTERRSRLFREILKITIGQEILSTVSRNNIASRCCSVVRLQPFNATDANQRPIDRSKETTREKIKKITTRERESVRNHRSRQIYV